MRGTAAILLLVVFGTTDAITKRRPSFNNGDSSRSRPLFGGGGTRPQPFVLCPSMETQTDGSVSEEITENRRFIYRLRLSDANSVCTITKQTADGTVLPVARSYNGRVWERVAGPFASTLSFTCTTFIFNTFEYCRTTLPQLEAGEKWIIATSKKSRTDDEKSALFLQSTTFGPTVSEAKALSSSTFATWTYNQMYNKPATSHREYYRTRADPRRFKAEQTGNVGNPCNAQSRWRQSAFTTRDRLKYANVRWKGIVDGIAYYGLYVDNYLRTVVSSIATTNGRTIAPGGTYEICFIQFHYRADYFPLRVGGACSPMAEVPFVNIRAADQGEVTFVNIPYNSDDPAFETLINGTFGLELLLKTSFSDSVCNNLPTDPNKLVFGKTLDGVWLIHDTHLILESNLPDAPMQDGGGTTVVDTADAVVCANSPRTYKNEDTCFLSRVANVCDAGHAPGESSAVVVCGSEGEIANVPRSFNHMLELVSPDGDLSVVLAQSRDSVWADITMFSEDQLRQRIAWTFALTFAITPSAVSDFWRETEQYMHYYDIFVRHAFGNYRDMLLDVSYSHVMGEMLGHLGSRSATHAYRINRSISFADENFAREILQLFSVGLVMLNRDGTEMVDATGKVIPTYSNVEITSYARTWTGLSRQALRGNIEESSDRNKIDPMIVIADYRDNLPKTDLYGGYIGDKYPLCVDIVQAGFLAKGSQYRMLGSDFTSQTYFAEWGSSTPPEAADFFELASGSNLYQALCKPSGGVCAFNETTVTLASDLTCFDKECDVDTLRVIKVDDIYFEYIRPPCVYLSFFDNPHTVRNRGRAWYGSFCMDPLLPEATEVCCDPSNLNNGIMTDTCNYVAERSTLATTQTSCAAKGQVLCDFRSIIDSGTSCDKWLWGYHWMSSGCSIQVKIRDEDGFIALVHAPVDGIPERNLEIDASHYFNANWSRNRYPTSSSDEGCGSCETIDNGCLCDTTLSTRTVYRRAPTSAESVISRLEIAVSEDLFDPSGYTSTQIDTNLKAYFKGTSCCDEESVFEATDSRTQRTWLLKNIESLVYIEDDGNDIATVGGFSPYAFRNPPNFHSISRVDWNNAATKYETEAVLDSIFYHPNVAPFVSLRLSQRLGMSNPSPEFIERATTAFETGLFTSGGQNFGAGKYGDLAATVAAIVLDPESTTDYLDTDPTYGSVREPLLKFMNVMRSLEVKPYEKYPYIEFNDIDEVIGEGPHAFPSIFSFFLSDYSLAGDIANAGLKSPEAQLLTTGNIVALMNGIYSLISYGFNNCNGGLSQRVPGWCGRATDGFFDEASARVTYTAPADLDEAISEASMILTGGRLTDVNKQMIKGIVEEVAATDRDKAIRVLHLLTASTPEFHATSIPSTTGVARPVTPAPVPATKPYKAIVNLMLVGGVDSFNMIVPIGGCRNDIFSQYTAIRGPVALGAGALSNRITTAGQVCSSMGVHPQFPFLKTMYEINKEAVLIGNVGVMSKEVDKTNFWTETVTQLFAHNAMQEEIRNLDPFGAVPETSPLGRFSDALINDYSVRAVTVDTTTDGLIGRVDVSPPVYSISRRGVTAFNIDPAVDDMTTHIQKLNGETNSGTGYFGEAWSQKFNEAIDQTDLLQEVLSLETVDTAFPSTTIGERLKTVAQLIKTRSRMEVERDVFYVEMIGFDTHALVETGLRELFVELNAALQSFVDELKIQEVWDFVTLVETSDFARTLSPNGGAGTDHAWGGHIFVAGGAVNGGRMLGEYPDDFSEDGPYNMGRGRIIPTLSYDAVFNALAQWFGIPDDKLDDALPNRNNFNQLLQQSDIFK